MKGRMGKRGGRRLAKRIPSSMQRYETYRNVNPGRPHKFCKTIFNTLIVAGAGATLAGNTAFNMDGSNAANFASGYSLPDLASMQALFRSFRIKKVVLTWRFPQLETTDTAQLPELYHRYNYDPNVIITTGAGVTQFDGWENMKTHRFTNEAPLCEYVIYPKVMKPLYAYTGVATSLGFGLGAGAGPQPWLDFSDNSATGVPSGAGVPYYGYAYYISNLPSGTSLRLDTEFHFECKDQI